MPFGKMNSFRNQRFLPPQQNQIFQPPTAPGQFGVGSNNGMYNQSLQRFLPAMGGHCSLPMLQGPHQPLNNFGGGMGGGMPSAQTQGYAQQLRLQQQQHQQLQLQLQLQLQQQYQSQRPMPSAQGYPLQGPPQGYTPQGYAPQWHNQGYGVQTPVQPAWEEPKKGGIKGFISNLMTKFTK